MALAFHYAARSDVGLVRSENQDSGYAGPHLLVVADGMGGHAGGDIASSVAVGELVALDGESFGSAEASGHLVRAMSRANAELGELIRSHPELQGMGTTVTALLRSRNKITLAHIGDSRAYLLRGDGFEQITHDHSFVQALVDEGRITADEADNHPQRSLVTRVLTGQQGDEPDVAVREARLGDRYLICSDGLSGFVGRDTIEEVLRGATPPRLTADRLVGLALRSGAPDNVTVIVADVVDPTGPAAPPTDPQVVGAASVRRRGTRADPVTPAAKAAALARSANPGGDEVTLAEEGPSSRGTRALRWLAAVVVAVVVLGAGGYAAYAWSQRQFYVGAQDGQVAVFRGVAEDVGPMRLSHVVQLTGISTTDLPDFYRHKVEGTISVDTRADADQRVETLRQEAATCAALKATGESCGSITAAPTSPAPTTTGQATTGTPTARPTATTRPTAPLTRITTGPTP